jgi:hypothetical protein
MNQMWSLGVVLLAGGDRSVDVRDVQVRGKTSHRSIGFCCTALMVNTLS